jgi:multimeric flavodoxin WrbA
MKKIAITYHSGYGHTARQAKSVLEGASSQSGVEAKLYDVTTLDDAAWSELDAADAIIFGAPTYMGSLSFKFKEFMEVSSKRWYAQTWKNKFAAGFTCSAAQSGDKLNALIQLMIFAGQHSMVWVSLGVLPGNNSSKGSVNDLNRLGGYSGAIAQANADQGAEGMLESDLKTASLLGQRVAEQLLRLK